MKKRLYFVSIYQYYRQLEVVRVPSNSWENQQAPRDQVATTIWILMRTPHTEKDKPVENNNSFVTITSK